MPNKINIAVFASTKGTDLQAIIDAQKAGQMAYADLKFVLSDKKDCLAMERAQKAGLKTIFINSKNKSREEFDTECLKICQEHKIDLIVLIGYMRIISKVLIEHFENKIMNIHPSLLPKYPGMNLDVHQAVLDNNETETGCTLHWVTESLDAGPIIIQKKVKVEADDTIETLKEKVQTKEKEVILEGIKHFSEGKL